MTDNDKTKARYKDNAEAMGVQFKVTKEESGLISQIVKRAHAFIEKNKLPAYDPLDMRMDLEAVHSNGCPLDFEKLLGFDDANLMHDILGIRRYIDRTTGKLGDFFDPRCSQPEGN